MYPNRSPGPRPEGGASNDMQSGPGPLPPTRSTSLDPRKHLDRRRFAHDDSGYTRHSDAGLSSVAPPSRGRGSSRVIIPPLLVEEDSESSSFMMKPSRSEGQAEADVEAIADSAARESSKRSGMVRESSEEPEIDQTESNNDGASDVEMGETQRSAHRDTLTEESEDFVFEQNLPEIVHFKDFGHQRSASYIESLPAVDALPEPQRHGSIVAEIRDVIALDVDLEAPVPESKPPAPLSSPAPVHPLLQEREQAALISVHIHKAKKGTPLGLVMENSDDYLFVRRVEPWSIFDQSPLNAGHKILSFDGKPCMDWTSEQAMEFINQKEGPLSILAENPLNGRYHLAEACVCKSKPSEKVGISFKTEAGKLYVSSINASGLLGSRSVINVGDQIVSICNEETHGIDPRLAKRIIQDAPKLVNIVVSTMNTIQVSTRNFLSRRLSWSQNPDTPQVLATEVRSSHHFGTSPSNGPAVQPAHISVVVFKPGAQTNLGLELGNSNGKLIVTKVLNSGLFAPTPLKEGHELLSVNQRRCTSWVASRASQMLVEATGRISIVAMNPLGDERFVEAMVMKLTPRVKIGIGFKSSRNQLKISSIHNGGLMADSVLNAGDSIFSINNVPCQHFTASQASALVKRFTSVVTVLTKTQHSSGVVVSEINTSRRGSVLGIPVATAIRTPNADGSGRVESSSKKMKLYLVFVVLGFAGSLFLAFA